jgi:hypothetical protein
MASTITAGNATNGLALSCDNTGILELKTGTGSGTTAVTIGTGQEVAVTLGSAAAPSITFSGDTNTGIFSPAADTIAFTEGGVEAARMDSSRRLLVGTTTAYSDGTLGSPAFQVSVLNGSRAGIATVATGTTDIAHIGFVNPNGLVGRISTSGSSTSYVTSSDYRLKENIAPMVGALATVAALNPVTYQWKIDGSAGQGFIAHELQAVVPDCVTGEKDAVDSKGNPVYQGIDTSFLVATLTAAIQELKAEVDSLRAQVEAQ